MGNNDLRDVVNHYLIKETDFLKVKDSMTEDQLRKFVDDAIIRMCQEKNVVLEKDARAAVHPRSGQRPGQHGAVTAFDGR